MKILVTGAAGFIGSTLVDRLLSDSGTEVVGYDNFSTGQRSFLEKAGANRNFRLVEGDILDAGRLTETAAGCGMVYHLSANADVRFGTERPDRDLQQNTIGTFNVLEAARLNDIRRIAFSSTGSVYGEATVIPTPENAPFPIQTSLYGASKLAGEGLVAAYAEGFGMRATIFRFVSILGPRYTHGHVFDFVRSLGKDPSHLRVLGNGQQRKSYLHVDDCISAMLVATAADEAAYLTAKDKTDTAGAVSNAGSIEIYNLGADNYCQVLDSVGWITNQLGVTPELEFSGGSRGWIGDNPFIWLGTEKIRSRGWSPNYSIEQGVRATVDYLVANPWLFEARA